MLREEVVVISPAKESAKNVSETDTLISVPRHDASASIAPSKEAKETAGLGTTVNAANVKGIPVISIADSEKVDTVDRIYVDLDSKELVGVEITEHGDMLVPNSSFTIDPEEVHSLESDALTIESRAAKTREQVGSLEDIDDILKRKVVTEGARSWERWLLSGSTTSNST